MIIWKEFKLLVNKIRMVVDQNIGLILLLVLVIFGLGIMDYQKTNRQLLLNQDKVQSSQDNDTKIILDRIYANNQRTLRRVARLEKLTCGLLLLHDPNLENQIPPELVKLCEEEVGTRINPQPDTPAQSDQVPPDDVPSDSKIVVLRDDPNDSEEPEPPEPTLLDRVVEVINNTSKNVADDLNKALGS